MEKVILHENETLHGGVYEKIEVRGKNVTIECVRVEGDGICLYSNYNCSGLRVRSSEFVSRKNNCVKIVADKLNGVIKDICFDSCRFEFARMGVELQNHGNSQYKYVGCTFRGCTFTAMEGTDYRYGLSMSGYGKGAELADCIFRGCAKGIEIAGFSDVTIGGCELYGSAYAMITSNTRKMENIVVHDCAVDGKISLRNCSDSAIYACEVKGDYIELKKSTGVQVKDCTVESGGHYSVLLDNASDCLIEQNVFNQGKKNWATVRCYGKGATGNTISNNSYNIKPKAGKKFDEYNGAYNNEYTE